MSADPEDLDFLAARTHARYGLRADARRLEDLSRHRTMHALWRAIDPGTEPADARALQRLLLLAWHDELRGLARGLSGPRARLLEVLAERLELEDRKTLVRGLSAGVPAAALLDLLWRPSAAPAPERLASAEDVVSPPPAGALRAAGPAGRRRAADPAAELARPFVLEALLDQRYLQRLRAALDALDGRDRSEVRALVHQEVDHFHLALVARGRFTLGLSADALVGWHVAGAGIDRERLSAMLAAPTIAEAAALAIRLAIDQLPPAAQLDARAIDAAAWRRYARLARRAFRGGGMRFPALVGYAALRRVDVKNLTTLSEGVRLGLPADAVLVFLVRPTAAVAHV